MEVAAIIPTRGISRKVFTSYQVDRAYAMGYDKVYLIDYPPGGDSMDLFERIAAGVARAIVDGIDFVSIIEDDDHYDLSYLNTIKPHFETNKMVGINCTTYYHLFSTGFKRMIHPGRSSMFCTSFAADLFRMLPVTGAPYHDIVIWKYAQEHNVANKLLDLDIALGIKHGNVFGKVGGNGHNASIYSHSDPKLTFLRSRVDEKAFEFYKEVKETFQNTWAHGKK